MFGVAKLVSEGFEKPSAESELPLDINYAKLVEWLVRRVALVVDELTYLAHADQS